ncbi:hypothetical protein Back2_20520 [Nocardioides baekrokdamisoli]|uniref:SD-repeat containing protein B domain-containing protein n=1 Tax=Nocardioides baekrokdamisoli TaxID=1804624 RepID=A0A3G9INY9_9ACTN|nr:hypothetical protein Back2_20520 [Nocardioides baekrokdamisoli]
MMALVGPLLASGAAQAATSGSISGAAYMDLNGTMSRDAAESAVPGLTVRLLDSKGAAVASTTTGANGSYTFSGLTAGSYVVNVVCTAALSDAYPGCGFASSVTAGNQITTSGSDGGQNVGSAKPISVASGQTVTGIDAAVQPTRVVFQGRLWNDWNGNRTIDAGEPGLANVPVYLACGYYDNVSCASTRTDASGHYRFDVSATGLPFWTIVETTYPGPLTNELFGGGNLMGGLTDPSGAVRGNWADINGLSPVTANSGCYVTEADLVADCNGGGTFVPAGAIETVDGAYASSIAGTAWYDLNADKTRQSGEQRAAGVTVKLHDASGAVVATTTTSADGTYTFAVQPPGTYRVQVVAPHGWSFPDKGGNNDVVIKDPSATPQTGSATVTVVAGRTTTGIDAGLIRPAAVVTPTKHPASPVTPSSASGKTIRIDAGVPAAASSDATNADVLMALYMLGGALVVVGAYGLRRRASAN